MNRPTCPATLAYSAMNSPDKPVIFAIRPVARRVLAWLHRPRALLRPTIVWLQGFSRWLPPLLRGFALSAALLRENALVASRDSTASAVIWCLRAALRPAGITFGTFLFRISRKSPKGHTQHHPRVARGLTGEGGRKHAKCPDVLLGC